MKICYEDVEMYSDLLKYTILIQTLNSGVLAAAAAVLTTQPTSPSLYLPNTQHHSLSRCQYLPDFYVMSNSLCNSLTLCYFFKFVGGNQ